MMADTDWTRAYLDWQDAPCAQARDRVEQVLENMLGNPLDIGPIAARAGSRFDKRDLTLALSHRGSRP